MRRLLFVMSAFVCASAMAQQTNPVTNGGFEAVGVNGFPVDWAPVGDVVGVSGDAVSGDRCLRLLRTETAVAGQMETGANRVWEMDSGEQGTMLAEAKGGIRFRYKVVSVADDAIIRMNVIAMDERPFEGCGVPRAFYEVPRSHVADGEWHEGLLAYDFSEAKRFRWLQVSPRVMGGAGTEWLIDDVEWVESVGPLPAILSLKTYELPGGDCQVRCLMKNAGDRPLPAGTVTLTSAEGVMLGADPVTQPVRALAPDTFAAAAWRLTGARPAGALLTAAMRCGERRAEGSCVLQPALDWIQFQAETCVLWPGAESEVSVVVYNRGDAVLPRVDLDIRLPEQLELVGRLPIAITDVPAASRKSVAFRVRARRQAIAARMSCDWAIPEGRRGTFASELVVGADPATAVEETYRIACETWELAFPKNAFGYGVGWVYSRGDERRLIGVIPGLGRLTTAGGPAEGVPLVASSVDPLESGPALGAKRGAGVRMAIGPACLRAAGYGDTPLSVELTIGEDVTPGQAHAKVITVRVSGPAPPEGTILALDGPRLTTWTGGKDEALVPGLEWLLGDEESSNDNVIAHNHPHRLRWRPHPHLVTVPMMAVRRGDVVTGLFWHPRARWNDGTRRDGLEPGDADTDRPTPVFAAPDRFSGHACASMGLSIPTVTTYGQANQPAAETGWPPEGSGATTIDLSYGFYVDTGADSALDALKDWFGIYGVAIPRRLPQVDAPPENGLDGSRFRGSRFRGGRFRGNGLPHWVRNTGPWTRKARSGREHTGPRLSRVPVPQWIDELDWSMQAYLETLWDPELKEWRIFHGGPAVQRRTGAFPHYLYDCVTTALLTEDEVLRGRLEARAKELLEAHPGIVPAASDLGFHFGDPIARIRSLDSQVVGTMKSQAPDGGWTYTTRVEQGGVFKGRDYAGLAHDGFEANGLAARKTWELLRAHRLTGDKHLLKAGLKGLSYMRKFHVPRAAQVWEVVGHAPDILAAADACQAYLEGYRATGDRQWLEQAVYWARAGVPFVYQWGVDDFPWMRYGSIPIFGSTWWTCTWFGRPVQWNGLRLAHAMMELSQYDDSFPWVKVAQGITTSALYQQGFDPENTENYALWPDVYNAVTGQRIEWNFAPRGIITNVHQLMGMQPVPRTILAETGDPELPMRVHGCLPMTSATYDAAGEALQVTWRPSWSVKRAGTAGPARTEVKMLGVYGRIVAVGVTEPRQVLCVEGDRELVRVEGNPEAPGQWSYDPESAAAVVFPKPADEKLRLVGVRPAQSGFSPGERTTIDYRFNSRAEGWQRQNDIELFAVRGGMLHIETNEADPYMVRNYCAIDGDSVSRIRVRMSASAGNSAQFFWTTVDEPAMAEDKRLDVAIVGDGHLHDVLIPVGTHPKWRGQTISSIRLDPVAGAENVTIRIDEIVGE